MVRDVFHCDLESPSPVEGGGHTLEVVSTESSSDSDYTAANSLDPTLSSRCPEQSAPPVSATIGDIG